jgi:hypothetical protein
MGIAPHLLQAILSAPLKSTILRIDTALAVGSGAKQFRLPLVSGGYYRFVADWGDGNKDIITVWNQTETTHLYAADGIYDITITGMCRGWRFGDGTDGGTGPRGQDKAKVTDILQWGSSLRFGSSPLYLTNGEYGFQGCTNLTTISAPDGPCMREEVWLSGTFWGCTNLVAITAAAAWDMKAVTTIYSLFRDAPLFNTDISVWDMSGLGVNPASVGGLQSAFRNALAFNQPIGGWDVAYCPNFESAFLLATAFNADISPWNVERGKSFQGTLRQAAAFKRDLGPWWPRSATLLNDFLTFVDVNSPNSPVNVITSGAQDFTDVAWTKGVVTDTVTANALVAPDGTITADKLEPDTTFSANHSWTQTKTVANATSYTVRVALMAGGLGYGQLRLTGAITADVYVDLATGVIVSSAGVVSVTDLNVGWWVLEIIGTTSGTSLGVEVLAWDNATGSAFAGDGSAGIYAWQASLFLSSSSTANYDALLKGWTGRTIAAAGSAVRHGVTATPTVAAPGSGYKVGDVLGVVGGTVGIGGKTVEVKVATIDGAGGVLSVSLKRGDGNYEMPLPTNPAATSGGTGVGCTLTLDWVLKYVALPTNLAFHGGTAKYSLKDVAALAGRYSLVLATGSGGKGWTITDAGVI